MKKGILWFFLLLGFAQLIPAVRENPREESPIGAPPEVYVILQKSCFDCHSNQTRWPWYSKVAPLSFWISDHVVDAREHINFSNWGDYSREDQAFILKECIEEIEAGEMPLKEYRWLHAEARLPDGEKEKLTKWMEERITQL